MSFPSANPAHELLGRRDCAKIHFVIGLVGCCTSVLLGCASHRTPAQAPSEQGIRVVGTDADTFATWNWGDRELPARSLETACNLACEHLGERAQGCYVSRAYSKVSRYGGGWEILLINPAAKERYRIHVGEHEQVLNVVTGQYETLPQTPTLSVHEAVVLSNARYPLVVTRACWDVFKDLWRIDGVAHGELGKTISLSVDCDKNVILREQHGLLKRLT